MVSYSRYNYLMAHSLMAAMSQSAYPCCKVIKPKLIYGKIELLVKFFTLDLRENVTVIPVIGKEDRFIFEPWTLDSSEYGWGDSIARVPLVSRISHRLDHYNGRSVL